MRTTFFLAAVIALAAGCGGDDDAGTQDPAGGKGALEKAAQARDWPSVAERTLEKGHHPTPYSLDQIRKSCTGGREITVRMAMMGNPAMYRWTFTDGDDKGCLWTSTRLDEAGQPEGEPNAKRQTWRQLLGHASYPAAQTALSEEKVTVGAGTFDCMLYTVTKTEDLTAEDGTKTTLTTVAKYWFAWDLPGPPVKMEATRGGSVLSSMEMMGNKPGA